ncbi:hypothetical protein NDU88_008880 [Pleurodeles waltl]|uniref:Uncharacterized protein n=1 Tax=Pleurodeles waltl TaxID=8319 RepID=A0AAV7RTQ3_PLEWA|nr:hypothetical protein NDU88_008880 [Pleurodeles waltl]
MTSEFRTGNREEGVVKRSASASGEEKIGEEKSGERKSDEKESCEEERGEQKSDEEFGERFLPSRGEEDVEAAVGEEKNQEDIKIQGNEYKTIRE